MATILTKKKDTTGAPATGDLTNSSGGAELAVNTADKRLYTKNSSNAVVEIGTNPGTAVTFVAGTASDPAITTTGDTNTGIFFPAADTIAFAEGGTEAMRIDSDGDVGIGTTAPAQKLHLAATTAAINLQITNDAVTTYLGQGGTGSTTTDLQTNVALRFNTGASYTERMRITSDGYLRMASGSGGIQFNGDTAAANALDDYEEGTWTPTYLSTGASFSYNDQYGTYTKVGRMVLAQFYIRASASGTTSNTVELQGLPVTSANLNALHQSGGGTWFSGTTCQPLVANNSTRVELWKGGAIALNLASDVSGQYLVGMVMYQAA